MQISIPIQCSSQQRTYLLESKATNSDWNCCEKPAIWLPACSPTTSICLKCDSEAAWHLNPFSSRHCFSQTWQYHRRRCKPFDFILFATNLGVPTDKWFKLKGNMIQQDVLTFSSRHFGWLVGMKDLIKLSGRRQRRWTGTRDLSGCVSQLVSHKLIM